jgi:protein SCO1
MPTQLRRRLAWSTAVALLLGTALWLLAGLCAAQPRISAGEVPEVGVRERVGTIMPLDLPLRDEQGQTVTLGQLLGRPTLLLFVYYRCPGICDPLMREVAHNLDMIELRAGSDYQVVTISFDPGETPEVAQSKKAEILATMKARRPPDAGWRFLTGPESSVAALTEAAGFKYRYDPETHSYLHATSLIFLTREGRIVRYLGGVEFVPAEIKLALIDAMTGRERSIMQQAERICYAYDPKSHRYVLQINRMILGVTGTLVLGLLGYLGIMRKRDRARASRTGGGT